MAPISPGGIVRVKICGITSVADAQAATLTGADAIGLNFIGGPRQIEPARAAEILQSLPPMVTPVALVRLERGHLPDELIELLGQYWVTHVQLYGEVSPGSLALLAQDGFRPIPVVPVKDPDFANADHPWRSAEASVRPSAVVLDAYDPQRLGGTGRCVPWEWVESAQADGRLSDWPPLVLAGGLQSQNVAEAVRRVRPYAVDVSSGVELEGMPGRKDAALMQAFVRAVRSVGN